MLRHVIAAVFSCFLLGCLTIESGLGLLQAEDSEENLFSVGENSIEVIEQFNPHPDQFGNVSKVVSFKNSGLVPAYVRALVTPEVASNIAQILYNDTYWKEGNDGYWYYSLSLEPFEQSEPFIFGCVLSESGKTLPVNLFVYVESVETYGSVDAPQAFESYQVKEEYYG